VRYKIGDVSGILGISPDMIRYYEEKGVVSPTKDPSNNYRYYDTWDINYLIDCLWYKNFGFGIEQIADIVSECSYDSLLHRLEDKSEDIMVSIRRQELLLQRIRMFCQRLTSTKSYLEKCDLRHSAEFVRYINRRNFTYDNRPILRELSRKWLKYMPFTRRYFEIPEDALAEVRGDYEWGFSLGMQYVEEFGVEIKPPVEFMPSRLCVHSAFRIVGKNQFSARHIDYMVDYAKANNLTVAGDAFGNLACSVVEDGQPTGYFEVWLPVEESSSSGGI
jgi:DNA-binding transcriptional MerR regulator